MKVKKDWKTLQPHPLAAEYPDWPKDLQEQVVETLKTHGNIDNRKVWLCQNLIIDGVQFHRACVAADIKPKFDHWEGDPELFVRVKNDHRRHETQAEIKARAERRRAKLADMPNLSNRAAAEAFGVSAKTIRNDREALSGGEGYPPESQTSNEISQNGDPKVVGKDGKSYPANKPPEKPKPGDPIFDAQGFEKAISKLVTIHDSLKNAYPMEDFDELEMDFTEWFNGMTESLDRLNLRKKRTAA